MAASLGRICRSGLLKANNGSLFNQTHNFSTTREWSRGRKIFLTCFGVAAGGAGALIYALENSLNAEELVAHPPTIPWNFYGMLHTMDHASMRRGWEVYKNVCSACHSLQYVAYRHLVNNTHTEEEAKALAEEAQILDGPNEAGEMYLRPGKLFDYIPGPYPNEEAARAANNGAYPPDLTFMQNARHRGEHYIFALLTGYCDPPAGVTLREGQYYNPYFPGGAIGMGQVVYDEVLEFEDGTPASASQIAKDVVNFLTWTSNMEFDERREFTLRFLPTILVIIFAGWYFLRHRFNHVRTTKLAFIPPKKKEVK